MAWIDLPSVPAQFKRRTGLCAEAARLGLVPSWPGSRFPEVKVPGPPLSQDDASAENIARHCASLYSQAYEWSGRPFDRGTLKAKYHMALNVLSRENYTLARKVKVALRQIRDGQSRLPLVIWAWWVVQRGFDKDRDGAAPQAVFDAEKITDAQQRGFFWRDCGAGMLSQPSLWTKASQEAHTLYQDFLTLDAYIPSAEIAANIWLVWYAAKFQKLADTAAVQHSTVADKVQSKAYSYDLGLWLTTDITKYLKIGHIAVTALK